MNENILQFISILISAVVAIVAIVTLFVSLKNRDEKHATNNANLATSMNYMQKSIDDINRKQDKMIDSMNTSERRISVVESVIKDIIKRIDKIERGKHD